MGCNSRIYVVNKSPVSSCRDNARCAEVVAMFDACRYSQLSEIFKKRKH